jgi:hypothetical protein
MSPETLSILPSHTNVYPVQHHEEYEATVASRDQFWEFYSAVKCRHINRCATYGTFHRG